MTKEMVIAGPEKRGGRRSGQDENAGADDAADAEQNQVESTKGPLQLAVGQFALNLDDALSLEDSSKTRPRLPDARHRWSFFALGPDPAGTADASRLPALEQRRRRVRLAGGGGRPILASAQMFSRNRHWTP